MTYHQPSADIAISIIHRIREPYIELLTTKVTKLVRAVRLRTIDDPIDDDTLVDVIVSIGIRDLAVGWHDKLVDRIIELAHQE